MKPILMLPFTFVFIATPSCIYGVIQSLVSTSSGSEHTYVCEGELHSFICVVTGTQLVWSINTSSSLRMEFFSGSDEIGHSITQPQAIGVLLSNNRLARQLQSALFVNYSKEYFASTTTYSITCSSETESDSLLSSFSAIPESPKFTQVLRLPYNQTLAHYHLQWKAPANTDSTSIDRYILSVGSRNNMSVHSTQTDIVVSINLPEENQLKIFAVDRCNQIGSDGFTQINQSEVPRVTDCDLSNMASSSESTTIVLYTILAVTGTVLLMTFVICISAIAGFKILAKRIPTECQPQPLSAPGSRAPSTATLHRIGQNQIDNH